MCSIYGAIGHDIDLDVLQALQIKATDRGRDGGRHETYRVSNGMKAVLGNWRATPTPEPLEGPRQPYLNMVHNGTIANDAELGAREGEIDSMVLARYINRNSLVEFRSSLRDVKGSYALAAFNGDTILAATNYKPFHYQTIGGALYFSSMARHFEGLSPFGSAPVALAPYTAIDLLTGRTLPLHRPTLERKRAVVIASAGLDSTVAATRLVRNGYAVTLLHFTYGAKAGGKEEQLIHAIGRALDCRVVVLPLDLKGMLGTGSSSLFDPGQMISGAVEGAEFAHEWVPARNFVFVAIATAWAEAHGFQVVALGNNLEEAGAYPDNEEQFTHLLNQAVPYAVADGYRMEIQSPVGNLMKHEIVALGLKLKAPFHLTWSCYRGGDKHCGECGPCFMRRKAFERNGGAKDPVFA